MQLKTILNRLERYKSFVYGDPRWRESGGARCIEVPIEPRKNGRPICSECDLPAPGYDRSAEPRRFEFVPLWGIAVFFVYRMRRVNCPTCGVKIERVLWCVGIERHERGPGRLRSDNSLDFRLMDPGDGVGSSRNQALVRHTLPIIMNGGELFAPIVEYVRSFMNEVSRRSHPKNAEAVGDLVQQLVLRGVLRIPVREKTTDGGKFLAEC